MKYNQKGSSTSVFCSAYDLGDCLHWDLRGHGGAVVTHSPPTSEVCGLNSGPYVGKLVIAYLWLEIYNIEP